MEYVKVVCKAAGPGDVFGRLTVKATLRCQQSSRAYAIVACECGTEKRVRLDKLLAGHTRSCGCLQREAVTTHGLWNHHIFGRWSRMMSRCYNPNDKRYARYGGRGIIVCDRWHDPAAFVADMQGSFEPGLTIDRKDNDGPYSPANCRWANRAIQNRNYSRNIVLEHDGLSLCLADWAGRLGVSYQTLWNRYKWGWSAVKVLTTPVRKLNKKNQATEK